MKKETEVFCILVVKALIILYSRISFLKAFTVSVSASEYFCPGCTCVSKNKKTALFLSNFANVNQFAKFFTVQK